MRQTSDTVKRRHLTYAGGLASPVHRLARRTSATFRSAFRLLLLTTFLSSCRGAAQLSFPGSVPRTVKLGLSAPFEGLYRSQGYELLYAVRLAARLRNGVGGVGGRYLVELVALNDFNEAQEAVLQAREMNADPGVLAVLGGWLPETDRMARPEYARLGVTYLSPDTGPARMGTSAALVAAQTLGLRQAAVLQGHTLSDSALAESFVDAFKAEGGSLVAWTKPDGAEPEASPLRDLESVPDLLFIAAGAPTAAAWIAAVRASGYEGTLVGGPEMGSSIVVDIAGEASEGVVFVSPYAKNPGPGDAQWVAEYKTLSGGAMPGPAAAWAFAAANRLLDAMDTAILAAGRPSREAVARVLAEQANGEAGSAVSVYVIGAGSVFSPLEARPAIPPQGEGVSP